MSGGSYNYLYAAEAGGLFDREQDVRQMADRLAGLGYAEDAARETEELLVLMRQARVRLGVRLDRLSDVWRAVDGASGLA